MSPSIYELCENGDLESVRKALDNEPMLHDEMNQQRDDFPSNIRNWFIYGDVLGGDESMMNLIYDIDHQTFIFGDWCEDLSSVTHGGYHDDSCICEYIRKLEGFVELYKKKHM